MGLIIIFIRTMLGGVAGPIMVESKEGVGNIVFFTFLSL